MTVIDYNGTGFWSVEEIVKRYAAYARKYKVATLRDLSPTIHTENNKQWIYPVMHRVTTQDEIASYLETELVEHFGLEPNRESIAAAASRACYWFDRGWKNR